MSKIIIFGASGFVGQALIKRLDAQSISYVALSSQLLDLAAADAAQKIAAIVHDGDSILMLSAYTPEKGDPRDLTIKNVMMIRNLLAGIEARVIKHFIYVSSDAVYPLTADVIDEHTPPCPTSLYGVMHVMREQYVTDYVPGEKLTILRPCAIYGDGDTHNAYGISRFIRSANEQGEITLFGNGEEFRDHIHVDDFADIILSAHTRHVTGVFNVATGQSWRFLQIAELIQSCLSKKIAIICKPRSTAILHRHTNITKLCSAFPVHQPRKIGVGIKQLLK